ncbi:MAG TPA: hypothetical protein PKC20_04665, partial [Burkholderiaceae bacterium]|nr:hypothetical protein [Burkholderiaceae bacterium]
FRHFAAQCDGAPGWAVTRLPCSHDVMVDMPDALADLLDGLAWPGAARVPVRAGRTAPGSAHALC